MKIIQILPELNGGGVERGTLELGKFLVERGETSLVISHGGRLVPQLEQEGSRHITLPVHKKSPLSLWQVRPLRQLFEKERPDVVHVRSRVPAWLSWLAWRAMPPRTRPRLITTVHGFYSVNRYSRIMTCGERVICVSNSIREYVLENYPTVPADKLIVIHRGVDPAEFPYGFQPDAPWRAEWQRTFPQLEGKCVITLPGRITRLKGHHDFLRMMSLLVDTGFPVHGLIVGGADVKKTSYLEEVQGLVGALGLDAHVTFTGHRSDLKEIFATSRAVVSLSTSPESFGRTVVEALAVGTPVVGYDHGGVGEILQTAFPQGAVPLGDITQLADRIQSLVHAESRPQPLAGAFDLSEMLQQTHAVYTDVVGSRQRAAA